MVPELTRRENVLTILVLLLAILVTTAAIRSRNIISAAKRETALLAHDPPPTLREAETRARMAFLAEEAQLWRSNAWKYTRIILSFTVISSTCIILLLITINLIIRAYDSTYPLPHRNSRLHAIRPSGSSVKFQVHLQCAGPTTMRRPDRINDTSLYTAPARRVPTVLYEPASRRSGTEAGEWLMKMRERGEIGRACLWDRPGYGFSDAASSAEIGFTIDALWQALEINGEKGPYVLVSSGFGSLLHRVWSSRHPDLVHGHVYVEAHTSQTYFLRPRGRNYFLHRHLPVLTSPISLHRIVGALFGGAKSSRIGRIYSSTLNPLTLSTTALESAAAHSRSSDSFLTLIRSLRQYPADTPTIVLSSGNHTADDKKWMMGQRNLWEEVTSEKGRVRWTILEGVGYDVCDDRRDGGRAACEEAVMEMVWS